MPSGASCWEILARSPAGFRRLSTIRKVGMAQPRRYPPDDAFMMDWENSILERHWDARNGIPKGPKRYRNTEWATTIKQHTFPFHSGVTWEEYVQWVKNGGGDEWFLLKRPCRPPALFCTRHRNGPLDVWYDCDQCVQEVQAGPMPQDGRYAWLRSINGPSGKATGNL